MPVTMTDYFMLQLSQQAMLYDLTYLSGRKESAECMAQFFMRMQELLPVTVTLELGAHEATFSRAVKTAYPERIVRAYEANPHVYSHFLLKGDMRRAGVDYICCAVGDRNGEADFYVYDRIAGRDEACDSRRQSLLTRLDDDSHCSSVRVPIARLDTLCQHDAEDARYALWIDVEGASRQVLEGAEKTLGKTLALMIELESVPKFDGQASDREVFSRLIDLGFIPILRDFQFYHQYNAIFVKKGCLALVEREWHRYFQAVLRRTLRGSFRLEAVPRKDSPIAPPPLERIRYDSVRELKDALRDLPLLRPPVAGPVEDGEVVVCREGDREAATAYYSARGAIPRILPLNDVTAAHDVDAIAGLAEAKNVRVWFQRAPTPARAGFLSLAHALHDLGVRKYSIEADCTRDFPRRTIREVFSDDAWDTVRAFTNELWDADSQYTYLAMCKSRLEAEPGYIPLAGYRQYDHPLVHARPSDVICEGGIENGGSTIELLRRCGNQGRLFAFEPLGENFTGLASLFAGNPSVTLEPFALWEKPGRVGYLIRGTNCARVVAGDAGDYWQCTSIDAYFASGPAPDLIKLDVEGAEPEVLRGARVTLDKARPRVMCCIYHGSRGLDWITVPKILLEYAGRYAFFCGHHRPWYFETVVYALPIRLDGAAQHDRFHQLL